jgi:hypothetical protein
MLRLPCPEQIRCDSRYTAARRREASWSPARRFCGSFRRPRVVTRPAATERHRMTDPHTSMSLTAVLVLAAVVMVTVVGWLIAVFLAGRQPAG